VTTQYVEILPPFGLFYHRVDHLRTFGTEQVIPEEARERGFLPDPISRPPDSTLALEEEMTRGRRNISPYYASVLKDRRKPISDIPPRGAVPGLTTGGVGRTAPDSGPGAPAASGARKSGGNAP